MLHWTSGGFAPRSASIVLTSAMSGHMPPSDFTARYRRCQKAMFCTQNVDSAWIVHRRLVNLLRMIFRMIGDPIDLIEAEDVAAFLSGVNIGYAAHLKMIGRKARAIGSPLFSDDGLDFLERVIVPDTNDQDAVFAVRSGRRTLSAEQGQGAESGDRRCVQRRADRSLRLCAHSLLSGDSAHDLPKSPR